MVEYGLAQLWAATSVEELHRLLVTRQVGGRSGQHQEAVELPSWSLTTCPQPTTLP